MSDAPGGGGYLPRRCITSGRLTPAAATLINTSPDPGTGVGRSTGTRTSGSPGSRISIAIMPTFLRSCCHAAIASRTVTAEDAKRAERTFCVTLRTHPRKGNHENTKTRRHEDTKKNKSLRRSVRRVGLRSRPTETVETAADANRIRSHQGSRPWPIRPFERRYAARVEPTRPLSPRCECLAPRSQRALRLLVFFVLSCFRAFVFSCFRVSCLRAFVAFMAFVITRRLRRPPSSSPVRERGPRARCRAQG